MEGLYLDKVIIILKGDITLSLEDVRYSQKGTIMLFQNKNDDLTVVNYDNVLYFTYTEHKEPAVEE